jgi:hypothetical protein
MQIQIPFFWSLLHDVQDVLESGVGSRAHKLEHDRLERGHVHTLVSQKLYRDISVVVVHRAH